MVQTLPGEVASGHAAMHRNSKWLINTYKFKTALGVGVVKEEFKLENAFGYWEQNNVVFEFRFNCVHEILLLTSPVSILSRGRWDYNN